MTNIAIIGTGLAALRAGLVLAQNKQIQLTFWEKSPSVGGRVATRRFESQSVNHGATKFDNFELMLKVDSEARLFKALFDFSEGATNLPKAMRDEINKRSSNIKWNFNKKVTKISLNGKLESEENLYEYDAILITAPLPQAEELLEQKFAFPYSYSKAILFLGLEDEKPLRIEMPADWSESHFELSDEQIMASGEATLKRTLSGLTVKKWRFARVQQGLNLPFFELSQNVFMAGEAFDPHHRYDCASAWISGLMAADIIYSHLSPPLDILS